MANKNYELLKRTMNQEFSDFILPDGIIKDLKTILLMMIKDFDASCRKHNVFYCCAFGTLLGAIRHKGFIPWDDDIDVFIKREDIQNIKTIIKEDYGNKYSITVPGKTKHDPCRFPKLMLNHTVYDEIEYLGLKKKGFWRGISIDLFVLDNVPNNKFLRFIKASMNSILCTAASCCMDFKHPSPLFLQRSKKSPTLKKYYNKRRFFGFFFSFLSTRFWVFLQTKNCTFNKKGKYLTCANSAWSYKTYFLSNWFDKTTDCKFENIIVKIPCGAIDYLNCRYGNWEEIPSIEKRDKHILFNIDFGEFLKKENIK